MLNNSSEAVAQTIRATVNLAPAATVSVSSATNASWLVGMPWQTLVYAATFSLAVAQIGFLIYRWWAMAKDRRKKGK